MTNDQTPNDEIIRHFPDPTSLKSVDCPECGKALVFQKTHEHSFFPFCNKRCKLLDLARWFRGEYSFERPLDPLEDEAGPLQ